MPENNPVPTNIPPMGATFKKPYMEFEFEGEIHRLENLKGGHNGRVAAACQTQSPVWNDEKQRWVIEVHNNLIDIDLTDQPEAASALPDSKSFLKSLHIINSPRYSKASKGYLIASGAKAEEPQFPINCEFYMYIRVKVPGRPTLMNSVPFKLVAEDLESWPPEVGTIYKHDDTVELYPEWVPFSKYLMKPIVKILPGDETIITEVIDKSSQSESVERPGLLSRIINRIT